MYAALNDMVRDCHTRAKQAGWWKGPYGEDTSDPNHPYAIYVTATKLALIHSEGSEALEGERKSLMDDKLPHRQAGEVELADLFIRLCDLAGARGYDLSGAVEEKLAFNEKRQDHKVEVRAGFGGKKI